MGAVAIMYAAQAEQAKADQQRWEAERARLEAIARARKLLRPKPAPVLNCVNCGAPKGPAVCEWCGTKHDAPPIGMVDLTTVYGIKGWR